MSSSNSSPMWNNLEVDDDPYYNIVPAPRRTDSDNSDILDSDEDEPAQQLLTTWSYGRRPEGVQSRIPRIPQIFMGTNKTKDQGVHGGGMKGRGRGHLLYSQMEPGQAGDNMGNFQQTTDADMLHSREGDTGNSEADNMSGDGNGSSNEAKGYPCKFARTFQDYGFNFKDNSSKEKLNINSTDEFPTLGSPHRPKSQSASQTQNAAKEKLASLKSLGSSVQGHPSQEHEAIAESATVECDSGDGNGSCSRHLKLKPDEWSVVSPFCIQLDGMPLDVDFEGVEGILAAYGTVLQSEKKEVRNGTLVSLRFRFAEESNRDWALQNLQENANLLLPVENCENYTVTCKAIQAKEEQMSQVKN